MGMDRMRGLAVYGVLILLGMGAVRAGELSSTSLSVSVRHGAVGGIENRLTGEKYVHPGKKPPVPQVHALAGKGFAPEAGVSGVSWAIGDIPDFLSVLVPAVSGLKYDSESPFAVESYEYPFSWEAQFVIIQGAEGRGDRASRRPRLPLSPIQAPDRGPCEGAVRAPHGVPQLRPV